jgi:hypothetical protein
MHPVRSGACSNLPCRDAARVCASAPFGVAVLEAADGTTLAAETVRPG